MLYQGRAKGGLSGWSVLVFTEGGQCAHLAGASRTHHYDAELTHGCRGSDDIESESESENENENETEPTQSQPSSAMQQKNKNLNAEGERRGSR